MAKRARRIDEPTSAPIDLLSEKYAAQTLDPCQHLLFSFIIFLIYFTSSQRRGGGV